MIIRPPPPPPPSPRVIKEVRDPHFLHLHFYNRLDDALANKSFGRAYCLRLTFLRTTRNCTWVVRETHVIATYLSWLDRRWRTSGGPEDCGYRSLGLMMKWGWLLPRQPCASQCSLQLHLLLLHLLLHLLQMLLTAAALDYWRNSRKRWTDWRSLPNCLWN